MSNTDRKLASIRRVSALDPIPNADMIEVATIDGWKVVVKKGELNVNDLCVYFEIDSWIPHEIAPFLSKGKEPREYRGVKGERLKTIKLKGQISQGLALPLHDTNNYLIGDDVTEEFNILKWEQEMPAQLRGKMAGNFPSFVPKTDQERIQNCMRVVDSNGEQLWEITEKLDGSSMTVFRTKTVEGYRTGVCSRNYELKSDDVDNSFTSTALKLKLFEKLNDFNLTVALQGELIGPGIQKNPYALTELDYYVFDIYDIVQQRYLNSVERQRICSMLNVKHVPTFANYETDSRTTIQELLQFADGQSYLNPKTQREGLVFKNINDPQTTFKVISNAWLLKND